MSRKLRIVKNKIPESSVLRNDGRLYDYTSSYRATFTDSSNSLKAADAGMAFFSVAPKWVEGLFVFRDLIAAMVKLKASENRLDKKKLAAFQCEPGQRLGLFKVLVKNDNEVVLGGDSSHLDFRLSFFLNQSRRYFVKKDLTVSTAVGFNTWFGRLYFFPVRLLHQQIVAAMLKGMVAYLKEQSGDAPVLQVSS